MLPDGLGGREWRASADVRGTFMVAPARARYDPPGRVERDAGAGMQTMLAQPLTGEPLPASQRPADALDDIAAALPDPGRPAAAGGAGGRARRRRFTLGRLPLWAVPAAIFLTLAGLT